MTEPIWVAIITVMPTFIVSLWNILKTIDIHRLVNSQMTAALKRIDDLEALLKEERSKAGDSTPIPQADPPVEPARSGQH
jgi:hypothetical protein